MKNIIIVILVLIILGLYFYTSSTKEILKTTGNAVMQKLKEIYNEAQKEKIKKDEANPGQWKMGVLTSFYSQ